MMARITKRHVVCRKIARMQSKIQALKGTDKWALLRASTPLWEECHREKSVGPLENAGQGGWNGWQKARWVGIYGSYQSTSAAGIR